MTCDNCEGLGCDECEPGYERRAQELMKRVKALRPAGLEEQGGGKRRQAIVMVPAHPWTDVGIQVVRCQTPLRAWKPDAMQVHDPDNSAALWMLTAKSIECFGAGPERELDSAHIANGRAPLPLLAFRELSPLPFEVPAVTPANTVELRISGRFRAVVLSGLAVVDW